MPNLYDFALFYLFAFSLPDTTSSIIVIYMSVKRGKSTTIAISIFFFTIWKIIFQKYDCYLFFWYDVFPSFLFDYHFVFIFVFYIFFVFIFVYFISFQVQNIFFLIYYTWNMICILVIYCIVLFIFFFVGLYVNKIIHLIHKLLLNHNPYFINCDHCIIISNFPLNIRINHEHKLIFKLYIYNFIFLIINLYINIKFQYLKSYIYIWLN